MSVQHVKETMDQIHISEEMQEELIRNLQKRMGNGKKKTKNWKKMAAVAAVLVLMTGMTSISVRAIAESVVMARMEKISEEETQELVDMIRKLNVEADSFSREYSDKESERMKELLWLYRNGTFPAQKILLVDAMSGGAEDTLSYNKDTGEFYLPERELTDEELLQIIDFNQIRNYALGQTQAAQEMREEKRAEQKRLREQVRAMGGISEKEAIEIARKQMESEIGTLAERTELSQVNLHDLKGDPVAVEYLVVFYDPKEIHYYLYDIDAADGSLLTNEK